MRVLLFAALIPLTFSAPADTMSDDGLRVCTSYMVRIVDDLGRKFRTTAYGTEGGELRSPRGAPLPDTAWINGPGPGETYNAGLYGVDANGNTSHLASRVAIANVGTAPAESCCTLQLSYSPEHAPGPLSLRNGFASYSLEVADSGAVVIETQEQTQRRYRARICELFGYWALAGARVVCP